jgi:mycothiol synthase
MIARASLAALLPADHRVVIRRSVGHLNELTRKVLAANGYALMRRAWVMEMDLTNEPQPPMWPAGIRVTTFERGHERTVLDTVNESFQDNWGHVDIPYERFSAYVDQRNDDRSLCFLGWAGDELAGCCLNIARDDGAGYVAYLAVRRPWRRQGLGLALLGESFRAFRRRGLDRAALDVDSENLTGATRLYERAGMHVVRHTDLYEKTIRF